MEHMPGDGIQPTVEEYLTRLSPPVYGSSPSFSRRQAPPATLDEAVARRRQAEDDRTSQIDKERASLELALEHAYGLIHDFLSRSPTPRHVLAHVERTYKSGVFGRVREHVFSEPIGAGWWLYANSLGGGPDPDQLHPKPYEHRCLFLLSDSRLVMGRARSLFHESWPKTPPTQRDIELSEIQLSDLESAVNRKTPDGCSWPCLAFIDLATALAAYL